VKRSSIGTATRKNSRAAFREEFLDIPHDFRDALLFLQDVGGELSRRQVRDVFLGARVFAVKTLPEIAGEDVCAT
jgi:hypothetical protein